MPDTPILSIIVPVFNAHPFLPRCAESILAQTFTDFELILVDDGSTDGSGEICDTYAARDERVTVIHKKNGGVVSARKAGINAARGVYAGYVDGDDWIEPNMYARMMSLMEKYPCDMVMFGMNETRPLPFASGASRLSLAEGFYDRARMEKEILPVMICDGEFYNFGISPVIWNKLFRRDLLARHQNAVPDDIRVGEDAACVYPYIFKAQSVYLIRDGSMYHYRRSSNQMTAAYDAEHFARFKSLYAFFCASDIAAQCAGQLDRYFAYCVKVAVGNELRAANPARFREKLRNIKKIARFAREEGFLDGISDRDMKFWHKLYFWLLEKEYALPLALGIYAVRALQRQWK